MVRSLILLLLLAALVACDLFSPREPEPPLNTNDPYAWKPPTSPELVLENLANAYPAHKINYHLDALYEDLEGSGSFTFFPDEGVASSQSGVFDNWGLVEEENFITKLFDVLKEQGLQRLDWSIQQSSSLEDRYEIIANYDLNLNFESATREDLPTQLAGQATLTLIQNNDLLYQISVWRDLKNDTLPCWSDLKTLIQ